MLASQYLAHKTVFYKRLPRVCFAWQHVLVCVLPGNMLAGNRCSTWWRTQEWRGVNFGVVEPSVPTKRNFARGVELPAGEEGLHQPPAALPPSLVLPPILADLGLLILLLAPLQTLLGAGWSRICPTSVKMGTRSIFRNVALSSRPFGLLWGIRITPSGIRITVK